MLKGGLSLKSIVLPCAVAGTLYLTGCQQYTGKELSHDLEQTDINGRKALKRTPEKTYNTYIKINEAIQEACAFGIENQGHLDQSLLSAEARFILSLIEHKFIDCNNLSTLSQAHDMTGIADIIYSAPNDELDTISPEQKQKNLKAFENAFNLAAMGQDVNELTDGIRVIRERK